MVWRPYKKSLKSAGVKKGVFSVEALTAVFTKESGKKTPEASESIDVAVKHPTGPYHVEHEIKALTKANGHRNILKFYDKISFGPNR